MRLRSFARAVMTASLLACENGEVAAPRASTAATEPTLPEPSTPAHADEVVDASAPPPAPANEQPVDEPCVADGTVFDVKADHVSAYVIDGKEDPALTLCRGMTYTFRIDAPFHPFWLKTEPTLDTGEAFENGVTNNGVESGDVVLVVPKSAPALLHYICEYHDGMQGELRIRD